MKVTEDKYLWNGFLVECWQILKIKVESEGPGGNIYQSQLLSIVQFW